MFNKQILLYTIILILLTSISTPQDNTQEGLPAGAIARLGKGGINIMRFSPDGMHLAVGTDVGVWLYDVEKGTGTPLFAESPVQVNALAFTDDGKVLASGGNGNPSINLWNIESKSELTTFSIGDGFKYAIALAFKGKILLCYERGGRVSYWSIDSGFISSEFTQFRGKQPSIFSLSGNILSVTDSIGKIHIFETTTKDYYAILQDPEIRKDIFCIAFSPDEKIIANAGIQKTIRLLDYENNKVISRLQGHSADITCVAYSNDGKLLASGDANKEIIVWNTVQHKERIKLKGHRNTINALAFAPEGTPLYGKCLASGSADGTIRFWDPNIDKELVTFASGHNEWVKAIAFDNSGSTLVSANYNGTVDYWSMKSYREIATFFEGECDYASDVVFSPDATRFACQRLNGYKVMFNHGRFGYTIQAMDDNVSNAVKVWSLPTGKELIGPWNKTTSDKLTFSQSNQILVVYKSNMISGWNLETGNELFNFEIGNTRSIREIKFSPDGKLLALHGSTYKLIDWNLMTPNPSPILPNQQSNKYAISPDGKTLAILSQDFSNFDSVEISLRGINSRLDTKSKIITANLQGFRHRMIFSPDSTILVATGSNYNEIILINVDSGEEIARLSGHTELIESFVFSHDGKILASCSHDGTVLLWDWEKLTEN